MWILPNLIGPLFKVNTGGFYARGVDSRVGGNGQRCAASLAAFQNSVRSALGWALLSVVSIEMMNGLSGGWNPPWSQRIYWPILAMFFASIVADLWAISAGLGAPGTLEALHFQPWLLGALCLGAGLARQLPLESIGFAAAGCLLLGFGVGVAGSPSTGAAALGLQTLQVALVWLVFAVGSLGTVRWILSRLWGSPHFGHGVLALTSLLMGLLLMRAEFLQATAPFQIPMVRIRPGHDGDGASVLGNVFVVMGLLAHSALVMQLLRNKRPVRRVDDATPLFVICAVVGWQEAANRFSS